MTRPDTAQDVLTLVRRSRLVDDARLDGFAHLLRSAQMTGLAVAGVLSLLVERGLLTRYQADELAAGRWWGFWIGGYRVLDRLGRGGMGTVFLAEHALLGKRVAVKVLAGSLQADLSARGRFLREARAAAAIDHPNIVHVYHADVDNDPPFLVMEYVDGVSLQAAVARHGLFAPGEAAAVGVPVARGLGAAAAVGLVHRDIKPANLLIDRQGQLKILDLGIARFTRDPDTQTAEHDLIIGTIDYLAPEQAENSSGVDPRADQYALGATLYYLLAGHPPHPDPDLSRKLHLKQYTDPTPLHHLRNDVPPGLAAVINRMLARDPGARFPTPDAAADALEPWAETGPDFPERLFLPWKSPGGDALGQPTDPGREHDPTPLPATRRIVRPRTGAIPNAAELPESEYVAGEVVPPPTATEDVPPTVRLARAPIIPRAESGWLRRWWTAAVLEMTSLFRRVLNRYRGAKRRPPPETPSTR
jgi:serine/threonine protein kinase